MSTEYDFTFRLEKICTIVPYSILEYTYIPRVHKGKFPNFITEVSPIMRKVIKMKSIQYILQKFQI